MADLWPTKQARDAERDALLVADDLSPLLDSLGIRYQRADGGRKLLATCPHPDHADRSPSWFINNNPDDRRFGTHYCLGCGYSGGPSHLARTSEGGVDTWEESASMLLQLFVGEGAGVDKILDRYVGRRSRSNVQKLNVFDMESLGFVSSVGTAGGQYLNDRGITDFDQALLRSVYADRGKYSGRVAIPAVMGGKVRTFAARSIRRGVEPRYLYPRGSRDRILWGMHLWKPIGKDVALVEGMIDAWAIRKVLKVPAYAVLGSRLSPSQAALIRTASSVTVVPDADGAGMKLVRDAAERLPSVADVRIAVLPKGVDPGDVLSQKVPSEILVEAYENAVCARSSEATSVKVLY